MKRSPLKRKTPLKAYAKLKVNNPMNKVSHRQITENALWAKIKRERINKLIEKFGCIIDEWTNTPINEGEIIDAHHNDRNRNNNTLENARLVRRFTSHRYITDNNIRDVPDRLGE